MQTTDISNWISDLTSKRNSEWAWQNFDSTVRDLVRLTQAKSVMEIGAGRAPMFGGDEISTLGLAYVANDISERELSRAPDYVEKACFDISKPDDKGVASFRDRCDVMFSKMVFEHIRHTDHAYHNIYALLAPGGVCLNFHPVLYSPPFVVNWLFPEAVTRRLLRIISPHRHDEGKPKFPAWYDGCVISPKVRDNIQKIGFRNVWQVPFYYHGYFRKLPGLFQIDRELSRISDRHNWTQLASFCFTVVQK